jgi:hypothetical protein
MNSSISPWYEARILYSLGVEAEEINFIQRKRRSRK